MTNFTQAIQQQCVIFRPFLEKDIEISATLFRLSKGKVKDFLAELEQTSQFVSQQSQPDYVEFYAQRLVQQFDLLKKAVDKLQIQQKTTLPSFKSNYRFAKNLKNLPACQKREEYQKALRALNEKISWLIEQSYQAGSSSQKAAIEAQIQETEYRKQKCLLAIEEIEYQEKIKRGNFAK